MPKDERKGLTRNPNKYRKNYSPWKHIDDFNPYGTFGRPRRKTYLRAENEVPFEVLSSDEEQDQINKTQIQTSMTNVLSNGSHRFFLRVGHTTRLDLLAKHHEIPFESNPSHQLMSPLVYLNDYTNKRLFFTVNEFKDDYVKVTVELGKATFKGFSIRQGEETFIKAVYFALEQACLEALVWMDSRWSKIEVGKGKPPIELAKEEEFVFVQDKDWSHPTFGPVLKVTAHQEDDNAVGLGRNIYLAATQAAQRLLIKNIPVEEVNVAVHSVYDPNHSWFKELEMDDKLVTLADNPPRKFTNKDYEECRRAFMEEYRPLSNYNVDIDDF